ncbi:(5-formylfuran-3-yl)methyl phosphate synthase [Pleomorphomonas sp. PLEO]|uniref:(5-formylfuran-3-yl)methyl phosphate synthase n=1 Tax=Pleomorphomonas sp. PLEO TaxID=3239306 RepID=UPI00351F62DC
MTALQVTVATTEEAQAAIAAGVTMMFAAGSVAGLPAPLSVAELRAILALAGERAEVVAAAGNLTPEGLADLAATGVAALVLPVPDGDAGAALLSRIGRSMATSVKLIAAFPPEAGPDFDLMPVAAIAGFSGVWLSAPETPDGLTKAVKLADIARFIASARRSKLTVALTGGLRVVDVGTLLPLRPDHLGFRAAVSENEDPAKPLDPARIRAVAAAFAIHTSHVEPEA